MTATPETGAPEVPESATYREVAELLRTFAASGWTGMTLRVNGLTITAGRHGPPTPAAPAPPAAPAATPPGSVAPGPPKNVVGGPQTPMARPPSSTPVTPAPPAPAPDTTGCIPVRSPAVGSFWMAPSPGAPPFTEPGRTVAEGDQLAIVEVMKLMNPVLAPQAGEIIQVCAANAELVEYEQILFQIRPTEPAGG